MARFGSILFLIIFVGGCASAQKILPLATTIPPEATVEEVLIATSRQPSDGPLVIFNGERSSELNFADIAVSIPSNRQPGSIAYPGKKPDPLRQFVPVRVQTGIDRGEFLSRLNARLVALPKSQRVVFMFIHGFNTDFAEGIYRQVQFRHDFDVPGVAVNFSWPSAGRTRLYLYDRDSAEFARRSLVETLGIITASKARSIFIIGHSMGALLTMEALRETSLRGDKSVLSRLKTLILAAPDIDIDVFGEQIREIHPRPENFAIFISSKDRALKISKRLRGGHPRVGEEADVDYLRRMGIQVLDLSEQGGSFDRINHSTFATSPALIAMARSGSLARKSLINEDAVGTAIATVGDSLRRHIYLPATASQD
ncbi:alpha/beta hydrolase [Oricola nitratireducens]|uniref:alpha/beta hydrolase n=1 Tax=Oricola nitratireducens TaxID=2775868 RepID=UPI0018672B37|nr:alpha/beta fold hydrolase [Oricola nitratireducens]